jgi:superfamily I DNA and/or RNA helicase
VKLLHEYKHYHSGCWIADILRPTRAVAFQDTGADPALEHTSRKYNVVEFDLIEQLVLSLLVTGIPQKLIGILSTYRTQVYRFKRQLQGFPVIKILTVDKFKGRDKDYMIVLLVQSNKVKHVEPLYKDW